METALGLRVSVLSCPKAGNSEGEYEDAVGLDADHHSFAIADGATEASFSGEWAQALTTHFLADPPVVSSRVYLAEWLGSAQAQWEDGRVLTGLPWYVQEKARLGAYATFLSLSMDAQRRSWTSWSVGDCCLLKVDRQRESIVYSFPLTKSSQFDSSPGLLGSKPPATRYLRLVDRASGDLDENTTFLLATDAMAQWLISQKERDQRDWIPLVRDKLKFPAAVEELRRAGSIVNDDTTLVVIDAHRSYDGELK